VKRASPHNISVKVELCACKYGWHGVPNGARLLTDCCCCCCGGCSYHPAGNVTYLQVCERGQCGVHGLHQLRAAQPLDALRQREHVVAAGHQPGEIHQPSSQQLPQFSRRNEQPKLAAIQECTADSQSASPRPLLS